MQINPSLQPPPEVIRDVPARLLATLTEGQRVQATVIARLTAETIRVQVGDSLVQLNSRRALQPGQQIQLERSLENGRPIIRISTAGVENAATPALLRQGQQLAVEVVKLLAQNRLLVTPTLLNNSQNILPQTAGGARLPAQIEVDISALKQTFRPGERLALQVLQMQPLAVQLKTAIPSRAELIQSYQRDVLPQFNRSAPAFTSLKQAQTELPLAAPVKRAVARLLQGISDRNSLQQAEGLRQALNNSGLFLENRLKEGGPEGLVQQDLKANLLQLAQVLKTQLSPNQSRLLDNPAMLQKLPAEVQTALRQLVTTHQELRALPAQVPPALANRGQTPMQLLLGLLSGLASGPGQTAASTNVAATQTQNMTGVQAFIQAKEMAASPAQAAFRAVEWQLLRDLLREVESASARIQFNQLSMLRDPDNPSNVNIWLFDLPVRDKQQLDMLQMRLEQHSAALSKDEEAIWQVQLSLETQNLGPMQARISLLQQDVKVVLLAEREDSAALLSRHIDALNRRLDKLGINVSHLSCRQAPIKPLTTEAAAVLPDHHLLDISV